MPPEFLSIDHLAIAVPAGQLEQQIEAYQLLGFREIHREEIYGKDQVREVLLRAGGDNLVQLLEPLGPVSPVQKTIERNGGRAGFAHVAWRVADIQAAFQALQERGFEILDQAPRPGSRGTMVFFVHPKSHGMGYLIEVVQTR
ncbi:MAG: VOC family protein [Acidobacteria bacterium]|nr:VOC family protein [Acidobacteriota bacterium]